MITVPIWSAQVFFVLVMTLTWHLLVFKGKWWEGVIILLGNSIVGYLMPTLWREDPATITITPIFLSLVSIDLGLGLALLRERMELVTSSPARKRGKA